MAIHIVEKAINDYGLPLVLQRANIDEDVEGKIDFKIIRTDTNEAIGIQFFYNSSVQQRDYKAEQLKLANDHAQQWGVNTIYPVHIKTPKFKQLLQIWESSENIIVGPESFLKTSKKVRLIQDSLLHILTPAEYDSLSQALF